MKKKSSYTVYFGSELFSLKHLIGNAYLAEAIYEKSHGRYRCVVPQNLEPRGTTARAVRDQDIKALLDCDLGLFSYDGTELDSGTVVEFMIAKFADIPSVILRSDIRKAGDQRGDPWNLMCSFYPRTTNVIIESLMLYRKLSKRRFKFDDATLLAGQHSSANAQLTCEQIASAIVRAFDRVIQEEPVLPKFLRQEVYNWLALMPGLRGRPKELRKDLEKMLERKVDRGLL
ncbi:MAG TPA: nucleoside 2-deoxyribosyltransferase [Opitutaceae bacterium]|nr:nucleoside 2-deoxyribosyltransferase [Opitutaceae bacterium]